MRISSLEGNPSLLKEVREKKINSREEKEELVETEDVVHLGNISDKVRKHCDLITIDTIPITQNYWFTHPRNIFTRTKNMYIKIVNNLLL